MTARGVETVLVGAGPGEPGLLTLAGAAALGRADVVVYDYLANPALLAHVPAAAERVYVGKKGFSAHVTQDQINALLVERACDLAARGGGVLVRLKGGDPFVFGRGGEEALALAEAGFSCSVVPGVTSGVAAPAFAGIPVTHRGSSSSVAFVTGNEDPSKAETAIDWDGIAHGADTLCFYMGVRNLAVIARRLVDAGRAPDEPVALVRWGTTARQEVLAGTLSDIAERAVAADFQAPAIIVVGRVTRLSKQLAWYAPGPLAGLCVAVTRTREQASGLVERLAALGADAVELPTIAIEPPCSYEPLDRAIERLAAYRYLVFTSANGVEAFFARLARSGRDARALAGARTAAIGPATALALGACGVAADVVPDEYRGEALAAAIAADGLLPGDEVLVARALEAREALPELLRARGARVDIAPAYRTVAPDEAAVRPAFERIVSGEAKAVAFTSSSTAAHFADLAERLLDGRSLPNDLAFYSIGPITSATARKRGLRIAAEASVYTIPGLVEAIVQDRASGAMEESEG